MNQLNKRKLRRIEEELEREIMNNLTVVRCDKITLLRRKEDSKNGETRQYSRTERSQWQVR